MIRASDASTDAPVSTPLRLSHHLRVTASARPLAAVDPRATPGYVGDRDDDGVTSSLANQLADLQERLFAEGRTGGTRSVLLILQGMDTSGKGGVARHVLGQVDPQGVHIVSFGRPTDEEKQHDFLWRVMRRLPPAGRIGVFDRSHYEAVLIERVAQLVPREVWEARYDKINHFERDLVEDGIKVVKVFLHISKDKQKDRLLKRLDNPTKHWKFDPSDIDARARWDEYQQAYEDALQRCNTDHAPWHIVPADRKWYRNWAVTHLLIEALEELDPQWPKATFDIEVERARLLASP